ncbi:hypothetical protein MT418_002866 [Batrachochytrium dendrobatidis]
MDDSALNVLCMSEMDDLESPTESLPKHIAYSALEPISEIGLHIPSSSQAPGSASSQSASRQHHTLPLVTLCEDKVSDLLSALGDSSESVHDLGNTFPQSQSARSADVDSISTPSYSKNATIFVSRTLDIIELDFKSLILPEMDIIDTPIPILRRTIAKFNLLRQEVLDGLKRSEFVPAVHDAWMMLFERIGCEILLYEQFLDVNAAHLTLEEIMNDPIIEVDENQSLKPGSDHSCATESMNGRLLHRPRSILPQNSLESLRSAQTTSTMPDKRRLSFTSSQYLCQPSTKSKNLSSVRSEDSFLHFPDGAITSAPPGPYDFVKWTKLRKLSLSLFSEAFARQVGTPTCFSVSGGIAVGTSKSAILLYDIAQNLLGILGDFNSTQASSYGAVTALSISHNHKQIFAGYARGFIIVWDTVRRISIKTIHPITNAEQQSGRADGHLSGNPIAHTSSLGKIGFVSADDRGSAFLHTISQGIVFNSINSIRIHGRSLNSSNQNSLPTTIYALSTLPYLSGKCISDNYQFIAISTPYKMAIMTMRPISQIQYRISWNIDDTNSAGNTRRPIESACLDWWAPVVQKNGKLVGTPRLAFSNQGKFSVLRILWHANDTEKTKRKINFEIEGSNQLDENIVVIRWLVESIFVCVTRSEHLVTVNASTFAILERVDISAQRIVFQPLFHKPLEAFGIPIELSYSASVCVYKSRLVFLGSFEIVIASLISWIDRIASLVRIGQFRKAFEMAISFYHGEGNYAVVGLAQDPDTCQRKVREHASSLILNYVSMSLSSYDPSANEDLSTYERVTETTFDTCIAIDRLDLLFGEVYDHYVDSGVDHVFVESLEPYVLNERIVSISNPSVVQAIIDHYMKRSWMDRLEQILLHLDPTTLNIHQILQICQDYQLNYALIYIYNAVLKDYVTPLVHLLNLCPVTSTNGLVSATISTESIIANQEIVLIQQHQRAYVIYVYLAYALTGLAFPIGTLTHDQQAQAKSDIYTLLLSPVRIHYPGTNSIEIGIEPFPYLRLLIMLDVDELIKMLGTVFNDESLTDGVQWSSSFALPVEDPRTKAFRQLSPSGVTRQLIVYALLQVVDAFQMESVYGNMENSCPVTSTSYTVSLFAFLARCYSKHRKHIHLSDELLERILNVLCESGDVNVKPEREVSILSIIDSGAAIASVSARLSSAEQSALLDKYEKANLWRVYEHMARVFGKYNLVLRAYLKDERRIHESLQAVRTLLDSGALTYQQSLDVKQCVFDYLIPLVELDSYSTSQLISYYWPSEHNRIIETLSNTPRLLYNYLKGLLVPNSYLQQDSVVISPALLLIDDNSTTTRRTTRTIPLTTAASRLRKNTSRLFPQSFYDTVITLMSEFDPNDVHPYLLWLNDTCSGFPYSLDTVFSALRLYHVTHATAWLLERTGDFTGALSVLLADLIVILEQLFEKFKVPSDLSVDTLKHNATSLVDLAVGVCERSAAALDPSEQLDIWLLFLTEIYFKLFLHQPPRDLKTDMFSIASIANPPPTTTHSCINEQLSDSCHSPTLVLSLQSSLPHQDHSDILNTISQNSHNLDASDMSAFLGSIARLVVSAVVGHVPLPLVIHKIVQTQKNAKFEDHRDLIFSMLESHVYHRELYHAATRIIAADTFRLAASLNISRSKGFRPFRGQCESCRRLLHIRAMYESEAEETLVVFACRHAFHRVCLDTALELAAQALAIEYHLDYGLWCPVCGRKQKDMHKHFKGKAKTVYKSLPDLANGFKDTPCELDKKYLQLQHAQFQSVPMITAFHSLNSASFASSTNETLDIIDMNDNPVVGDGSSFY